MAKCIIVLEDNDDRRAAMRDWLGERLSMYKLLLTDDPDEFIEHVDKQRGNILAVSLDHDLHERPDGSTAHTGMQVVDRFVEMLPAFPVLLHTNNERDGRRMRLRLKKAGWKVDWVVPFDGTNWVATEWYYALKRAIRAAAQREQPADDRD